MSFFSSLIIFHPGRSPMMKLREAREFSNRLRTLLSLGDVLLGVSVKYGKAMKQSHLTT
jgi:hypothetical protein